MRILVTGAGGFIGSHVTEELVRRGHEVTALVEPGGPLSNLAGIDARRIFVDVRSRQDLRRAATGQEVLLHLAAIPSDWAPAPLIEAVNVGGTRNLVAAALEGGCRRLVLMSSLAVHASSGHRQATEETPRDRRDLPYANSKRRSEDLVLDQRLSGRLEGVVIRPGLAPFGPRDRLFSASLCRILRKGGVLPLVRGGTTALCTSYVENLAKGVALATEHPGAAGEVLVMADDGEPSWREFFGAFAEALGVRPRFPALPWAPVHLAAHAMELAWGAARVTRPPPLTRYRVDLMRHDFHFSSRRAKALLGYSPEVSLKEGVARTVAWVQSQGLFSPRA